MVAYGTDGRRSFNVLQKHRRAGLRCLHFYVLPLWESRAANYCRRNDRKWVKYIAEFFEAGSAETQFAIVCENEDSASAATIMTSIFWTFFGVNLHAPMSPCKKFNWQNRI